MTTTRPAAGGLLRSELLKAATTPVTYGMLLAILAMTALNTSLVLTDPYTSLATSEGIRQVFGAGRDFIVLFVALGAVGAAGEFRHGTAIPTFLATPVRHRVVCAKVAAYLGLGCVVALIAAGLQLAIALPYIGAHGHAVAPWSWDVASPVIANVLSGAAYAALGVAIGLLVRNQLVALVVAVGWFTVVESALAVLVPDLSRVLPGGLFSGVDRDGVHLLPLHAAIPLLAAYVVAIGTLALRTTLRRDVG